MERTSWGDYFMTLAHAASRRSACLRRHVGAVAVRDNRVISTGYNGPIANWPHCTPVTCQRTANNIPSGEQLERCWAVHAEQNIVAYAARYGVSLEGSTVYCTHAPCMTCTKILLASGVVGYYYDGQYPAFGGDVEALWGERMRPFAWTGRNPFAPFLLEAESDNA